MNFRFRASRRPSGDPLGPGRYRFTPELVQAVNIAIAVGRPILVLGPPGCGKSQLAGAVHHQLELDPATFHRQVVSSRTEADELCWTYDAVGRLRDAQASVEKAQSASEYVHPGPLWQAFAPKDPPPAGEDRVGRGGRRPTAVVLIDEIDKAEPEVPNNLLDVLDQGRFRVPELDRWIEAHAAAAPFLVITSNRERALSPAFVRRCVVVRIGQSGAKELEEIAVCHFGPHHRPLYTAMAGEVERLRGEFRARNEDRPGTAEYLDAVEACIELEIRPPGPGQAPDPLWARVSELVLSKPADGR